MVDARRPMIGLTAREFPVLPRSGSREVGAPPTASAVETTTARTAVRNDPGMRRIAAEVLASLQSRLPGRIRDLKVRIQDDHFVLTGVSSSYYVKQVAQHVAMCALEALTPGRLVNEIEVRALR